MSLMRLNFLATYLRNLGIRDTTQVVEGMSFAQVVHHAIPSLLPVFSQHIIQDMMY